MIVARTPAELAPERRSVAIGTFDGVHRGHRRVLDAARAAHLRPAVVTFDPHPRTFFGRPVELLSTLQRRLELLEEAGIEDVLVLRFDEELASLEPAVFADSILRGIGAEVVAAGEGFRFGRERAGDLGLLEQLGFDVRRVPIVDNISSSHVRNLLAIGDVAHAATLLGRPPEVEGIVVLGDQRGRLLGFPTANLRDAARPPRASARDLRRLDVRPPDRDFDRHESALPRHGAPGRGPPPRLRRRPLRPADDLRLWQRLRDEAAFGSEAELVPGGDRPRRRADARGRAARLSDRRSLRRGRFLGMESPSRCSRWHSPSSRPSAASTAARPTRSPPAAVRS